MSKENIGWVLVISPFLITLLVLWTCDHIKGWDSAIYKYKEYGEKVDLVFMIVATILEIMLSTGIYLLLTK
jgi:hypothetical protein